MPELPEVEIVTIQLKEWALGKTVTKVTKSYKSLRFEKLSQPLSKIKNQKIQNIVRRGKYIIWNLENVCIVSHLGMSGQWKIVLDTSKKEARNKHTHIEIQLSDGAKLEYIDPRRFGCFVLIDSNLQSEFKLLKNLGLEPLSEEFVGDYLWAQFKGKSALVKNIIMNQSVVVGVGNIYAAEALFLAKINPMLAGKRVTREQSHSLVEQIKLVLLNSIANGGSSIDDFVHVNGQSGNFQNLHLVYGKNNENCVICATKIKSKFVGGRNTFWCPACQKKR